MFTPAVDRKILGKSTIPNALSNFAKHLYRGCLDPIAHFSAEEAFPEVGKPISKGIRKGLHPIETIFNESQVEAKFRSLNNITAISTTLGDFELETRCDLNVLEQNYNVDVKNGKNSAPNHVFWRFEMCDEISLKVLGAKVFGFYSPSSSRITGAEPLLGWGQYRYSIAIAKGMTELEAKAKALEINNISSDNYRWPEVHDVKLLFGGNSGSNSSIAKAKPSINPYKTVFSGMTKRVQTNASIIKTAFTLSDKATPAQEKVIMQKTVEILNVDGGNQPLDIRNLCEIVAAETNVENLEASRTRTIKGPLLTPKAIKNTLTKSAVAICQSQSDSAAKIDLKRKRKRERDKELWEKEEGYPLTVDKILIPSLTQRELLKYLRKLEDSPQLTTNIKGNPFFSSKNNMYFIGLRKKKHEVMYLLRQIFQKNCLEAVDLVDGQIVPQYCVVSENDRTPRRYSFYIKGTDILHNASDRYQKAAVVRRFHEVP